MWKVINCLSNVPDANSPKGAMSQNGGKITDTNVKANIFIHHYARVMGELTSAICKIKHKGATDPDGIPPTFLKFSVQLPFENCSKFSMHRSCMLIVQEFSELLPSYRF